ncbi:type IV pilus modification protein PilV [Betaproteobacteria bacterium]|nr:type IV pilus modification protein PilV [Betaproteobacteria bacterium]
MFTMKTIPLQSSRQTGSSLLEVMISVFILAFGLLGIAGMQISSLRTTQSSLERSQAVFLTHTILDAMRANMTNPSGLPSDLSGLEVKEDYANAGKICVGDTVSIGDDLARADLNWWLGLLKTNLGDGDKTCGQVECEDNLCTVTIEWDDRRGEVNQTGGEVINTVKNRSLL